MKIITIIDDDRTEILTKKYKNFQALNGISRNLPKGWCILLFFVITWIGGILFEKKDIK